VNDDHSGVEDARLPEVPIHERLGIVVTEAAPDRVVGTLPVAGNTQPSGLLHGGASCVLAESLAQSVPRCTVPLCTGPPGWSPWVWTSTPPTTGRFEAVS
jgi:acyl-coenzyme A thioesterase PaaI-like protein